MTVRQNKDDDNSPSSNNNVSSIKIIGGTYTFSPKRDLEREQRYQNWVEESARIIKPCAHSMKETEQFILQQCDVLPMSLDDHCFKSFQFNIVMNYLTDELNTSLSEIVPDRKDIEIKHELLQNRYREIVEHSPDFYGLTMKGYYLPVTERNHFIYDEISKEGKYDNRMMNDNIVGGLMRESYILLEETTEHIECTCCGSTFFHKLIVFKGVKEEDIRLRTPRFIGYLHSMSELGYLSDINNF